MEACLSDLGYHGIRRTGQRGGGCISQGETFHTDEGKIFVKQNENPGARMMFEGEMASLLAIAETETLRVPTPVAVLHNPKGSGAMLVMEHLDMTGILDHARLGEGLARLHLQNRSLPEGDRVDQFGFDTETCCGSTPQSNAWSTDWPAFYTNKLQEQISGLQDTELYQLWSNLKEKIPTFFTDVKIEPSLLHGDLWSGNAAQTAEGPVVFDAASFFGHHEFDLGITFMFGGFSQEFYTAYHALIPRAPGFRNRQKLYKLFHQLNHWTMFGESYKPASIKIMQQLLK